MSEIDDLMVDVMMRGDDAAENAVIRLTQLAEAGEISAKQNRHVLKAVERRIEKAASGTDLHEFLLRLAKLIDPKAQPQTSELPPEMESPDAVLARRMGGDTTPANYEAPEKQGRQPEAPEFDVPPPAGMAGMDPEDLKNFVHPKKLQPNKKQNTDISDYYHPDKKDD